MFIPLIFISKQTNLRNNNGTPLAFSSIRSDLVIPVDSVLLKRPELINLIKEKLEGKDGIQTVALVGMGGAGKTTLARHFGGLYKASIVWGINAETKENVLRSFEGLADALCQTENDKKCLREALEIKDPLKKEERIIFLVRERLKNLPGWLLIYDNVENFTDCQKHFPSNEETWGTGKVILTSRNRALQHNSLVNSIILIEELSKEQKLTLFSLIMQQENNSLAVVLDKKKTEEFLEEIPSFPLDVSVAAYYLNATNTSYQNYLEHLKNKKENISELQKSILEQVGECHKTRYRHHNIVFERYYRSP